MTLLRAECFDLYGTSLAALALRGYTMSGGAIETNGRTGTHCFRSNANVTGAYVMYSFTGRNEIGAGVAINLTTAGSNSAANSGLKFGDATSGLGCQRIHCAINGDLGFNVYKEGTLLGSTAPNLYSLGSYGWLEVLVRNNTAVGGGTGTVEVRYNNNLVLFITGVSITTVFTMNGIGVASNFGNATGTVRFDDWVIWDTAGTKNNTFLGDRRCVTRVLDADGLLQDWTPSTGVDGYPCIDELTPSDVDYVTATTAGDISDFEATPNPYGTNNIAALVPIVRMFKMDAGVATAAIGVNSGGTESLGANISPGTGAAYYSAIIEDNPNGNVSWTPQTGNDALLRIKKVA